MRIALCGRGGTGKTTLAAELSRVLALPLISEQVRVAAKRLGHKSITGLSRDARVMLQTAALCSQATMEELHSASGFVSDRSRMDYLAYYRELVGFPDDGTTDAFFAYSHLAHSASFNATVSGYDLIVFVPPHSITTPRDGFRFGDDFRALEERMEFTLRDLLKGHPSITLRSQSVEERLAEVLAVVRGMEREE